MSIRRLTVRTKLLASFATVFVLLILLVGVAVSRMATMDQKAQTVGQSDLPAVRLIGDISTAQATYRTTLRDHILSDSASGMQAQADALKALKARIAGQFRDYGKVVADGRDRALWHDAEARWGSYVALTDRAVALSATAHDSEAYGLLTGKGLPIFRRLSAVLARWTAYNNDIARADVRKSHDAYTSARSLLIVLAALAIALGCALALLIGRSIARRVGIVLEQSRLIHSRGLGNLQAAFEALAHGDLTLRLSTNSEPLAAEGRDEIAELMAVINDQRTRIIEVYGTYEQTREQLSALIGQVAGTAGTVSSGSQQVAATSEEAGRAVGEIANAVGEVAAGSQRQVTGIDEARRLTDEVVDATHRSAQDATATAAAAEDARRIAGEGAAAVVQATEAMASVRAGSLQATETIRRLGAKSVEIGGIVETITGIAEQTNLLALNAAIEAARAGDQGRGFAVVADEVRKLAEESQAAARSIAALVAEIQAETGRAVDVVEDGAARTVQGAETVDQARDAFERIGGSVDDVTARVGQIAAVVQQIAASAQMVGERMADVAAVAEQSSASTEEVSASTEQTSASTQEIAASAQELARSAGDLEQLVARFTLD